MAQQEAPFIGFTADGTHLMAGTSGGFQLFELPPRASSFRRIRNDQSLGAVGAVCVIPGAPVIAVLGPTQEHGVKNRRLQLYDTATSAVVGDMHFDSDVLGIRMNTERLAVINERHTHLLDLRTLRPLPQVRTTNPLNTKALGALSPVDTASGVSYYAFPHSARSEVGSERPVGPRGDVCVLDATTCGTMVVVPALSDPIVQLEFSGSGTCLAVASSRGTTIKVFAAPTWLPLYCFFRGQAEAVIHSLAINHAGDTVAVTSSSGTLHVFRGSGDAAADVRMGNAPEEQRAVVKLQTRKERNLCALSPEGDHLTVVMPALNPAAPTLGTAMHYALDPSNDKCRFVQEYPF